MAIKRQPNRQIIGQKYGPDTFLFDFAVLISPDPVIAASIDASQNTEAVWLRQFDPQSLHLKAEERLMCLLRTASLAVPLRANLLALCWYGVFYSTTFATPVNLVPNGDFESGNTLFTTDYLFNPSINSAEAQYTVRSNPFPWNGAFVSIGDHTSSNGLMMVANGSPVSGAVVWKSQPIPVAAATNYFFEAFVNNVCCQGFSFGPGSESILEFSLIQDGGSPNTLGTITTNLALAGTWEGLSTQYMAPTAGSVELSLINRNTNAGGNDFAIDDVYFGTESTVVPEPASHCLVVLAVMFVATVRRKLDREVFSNH